jgi:molybdate transport system ATP-binding protein
MTQPLQAQINVTYPSLTVDVELAAAAGEIIGLTGHNGSGKTTVLRAIAGLRPIDDGLITIDEAVVDSPSERTFIPPEHRGVGFVFQDYRLFPHLNALENIAFGLRSRGVDKQQAHQSAEKWLSRIGLADLGHHKPTALSGGQAQRVAIARALITQPKVLLLDEPFAALDETSRPAMRADLVSYLAEFQGVTLLVSHDAADIDALATRSVTLVNGRIQNASPDMTNAR